MSGIIIPYMVHFFGYLAKLIYAIADWVGTNTLPIIADVIILGLGLYLGVKLSVWLTKKIFWLFAIIIAILFAIAIGGLGVS